MLASLQVLAAICYLIHYSPIEEWSMFAPIVGPRLLLHRIEH